MKCFNCPYFWEDEPDDLVPSCHFEGPEGWAPCEQEEEEDGD